MKLLRTTALDMVMLYAGRVSAVLVGFIFLPFYRHHLGPEQFGVVAVILSLQNLLIMLDLGMSTLIGRDVAIAHSSPAELLTLTRTAEISLTGFYFLLIPVTVCLKVLGAFSSIGWGTIMGAIALFWVLVLQNMYYATMLARREYSAASTIQVVGVAARACATAYVLAAISNTMMAFIVTQLVFSAGQALVTRYRCFTYWIDASRQSVLERPGIRDKEGACAGTLLRGGCSRYSVGQALGLRLDFCQQCVTLFSGDDCLHGSALTASRPHQPVLSASCAESESRG